MTFGLDGVLGKGAGTPFPKRNETADVSLAQMRLDAEAAPCLGDATGARSGPLAKIAGYYHAHLARNAIR
jgi:hypothetical protein